MVLANDKSPAFALGGFQSAMAFFRDEPKITDAFSTGRGVDWGDHDPNLYEGTERFFKPNYVANIVSSWIPLLDGGKVEKKLKRGALGRNRIISNSKDSISVSLYNLLIYNQPQYGKE